MLDLASSHAALLSHHFLAGRPETSSDASSHTLSLFRGEHATHTGLEGHLADWGAPLSEILAILGANSAP